MSAVRTVRVGSQHPRVVKVFAGPPGTTMTWRGAWSSAATYGVLDAVSYLGSSYICIAAVGPTATTPDADGAHWDLLAEAGTDGTGTVNQVNGVDPVAGNVTLEASDIDGFAPVAISGSYADLDDKPSIPDSPDDIGAAADDDPRFVGVPVSTKTAAYTLVAGDAGSIVEVDSASAVNITVPASTFSAGQIVEVCQYGAGQVTIVAGSGVTLRNADGLKVSAQYGSASIRFRSATEAVVSGSMTT